MKSNPETKSRETKVASGQRKATELISLKTNAGGFFLCLCQTFQHWAIRNLKWFENEWTALCSNILDLYSLSHRKFDLTFADDKLQAELADLIPVRLNLVNPFELSKNKLVFLDIR